jgi:hypothetical protein
MRAASEHLEQPWNLPKLRSKIAVSLEPHLMAEPLIDSYQFDRTAISVGRLCDPQNDWEFWCERPIEERWTAMELLRQAFYGDDAISGSLQRVLEIAQLERR